MKLSIIIPAYNEAQNLSVTVPAFYSEMKNAGIPHEILVVNDNSTDDTPHALETLKNKIDTLRFTTNPPPRNGYGYAVRRGLENFEGDCAAIVMADLSDSPKDLVAFYNKMKTENYDCVFGSRFIKGGNTSGYPKNKYLMNRLANTIVRIVFGLKYNDCTNSFKLYKRETIEGLKPFISPHFNLTLELPLKAIVRGYSYCVIPNSWTNRKHGVSNLKIREMGSRYFFILIYCLIEKYFSKGDFRKKWN
jgi:dolichol-phosphate mannosyltransferase